MCGATGKCEGAKVHGMLKCVDDPECVVAGVQACGLGIFINARDFTDASHR